MYTYLSENMTKSCSAANLWCLKDHTVWIQTLVILKMEIMELICSWLWQIQNPNKHEQVPWLFNILFGEFHQSYCKNYFLIRVCKLKSRKWKENKKKKRKINNVLFIKKNFMFLMSPCDHLPTLKELDWILHPATSLFFGWHHYHRP